MTPAVVELMLLAKAAQLDTYGIDPHPVKVSYALVYVSSQYIKIISVVILLM